MLDLLRSSKLYLDIIYFYKEFIDPNAMQQIECY